MYFLKTPSLSLTTMIQVILASILQVTMHVDTKYTEFIHTHFLKKVGFSSEDVKSVFSICLLVIQLQRIG